ncbi:hypothetical protein KI655_18615 [Vibrio sp. D404a]|uniref:hypothetical protein n=1 Tax=unclassified Vibrio TaxID=2614977 RepID=UPI002557131F|nr:MULTISPECIES: hypothetical protein [unclassified Vibrio]MDK9739312.1 hypothetical protein [Vibrio sp. D404a]MDK9797652.1 hypothetical protein [Vibrio sp. D449a]
MTELDYLYAFIADNGGEEGEGIIASMTPLGATPLVTGSYETAMKMKPLAENVAEVSGKEVRMVKYARINTIEVMNHSGN